MLNIINKLDYNVAKFFHNIHLWGGNFVDGLIKGISYLAEAGILFLLVGIILILFKKTRRIGGTILLSVAIGFLITNVILKPLINRARPFENIGSDFYKWWLSADAIFESGHSFPSGHTTATTAFSVAIFLTVNKKYSAYILLFPIAMAGSRIYLMVHYFSDCVGGLLVGTISAIIAYFIMKLIYSSKLKFFVWARELDIFKHKQTSSVNENNNPSNKDEK